MKGHIRKRGPKTYAVVVELGKDATGKRRQKWHTVHGSKKNAERELARILHELNTGMYAEPDRMLVRGFLDRWLADYAKHNCAPRTYEGYAELVKLNLSPAIGHLRLSMLRPLHIKAMETAALENGRKDGEGGLSPRTVLHMHRVLRSALQQAVRWQLLPRNPADAVTPPKPERTEMIALDERQAAQLLRIADGDRLHVPVLLALTTGMRRGEILALQWTDVDLDAATLSVRRALVNTAGGLAFGEPKTDKSRRSISLMPITVDALRNHGIQQTAARLAKGPAWNDHDLVCPTDNGSPWHPDTFTSEWRKLVSKMPMRPRFMDLRHTHASQLLRQGVHPKIVSERLGHSTIGLTMDTYSHVLPGMQDEAAAKLGQALSEALLAAGS